MLRWKRHLNAAGMSDVCLEKIEDRLYEEIMDAFEEIVDTEGTYTLTYTLSKFIPQPQTIND